MREIFIILLIVFLYGCKEEDKYRKLYPFFKNVNIHRDDGTITLNNFSSNKYKEGIEYLLDINGRLIESRLWKHNYMNGYTIRYSSNNKPMIIGYMKNDTLNGNYFLLDTISGNVLEYRESLNNKGSNSDNQIILFKNGKIDFERSSFLRIKKVDSDVFRIYFYAPNKNVYLRAYSLESNTDSYDFDIANTGKINESDNNDYVDLKVNNNNGNYVSGYIVNYRHPTLKEIKEENYLETDIMGPVTYFKFKIGDTQNGILKFYNSLQEEKKKK